MPTTIYGVDFTSAPSRRKPITCDECRLDVTRLRFVDLHLWSDFDAFSAFLASPGPWIAGLDFPFGQARKFVETIGWPSHWAGYVGLVSRMTRREFYDALTAYRLPRATGDKEHRRKVDVLTRAISPQKLHGVPVGLMFYEGAPRLLASGVMIPLLQEGDPGRVVVEAYPGVMARRLISNRPYKSDDRGRQTTERLAARREMLGRLKAEDPSLHGLEIDAPDELADAPSGDPLDALLCAVQAAWAWQNRAKNFGIPTCADPLEGWISDPGLLAEGP
ncbi:DUF429 domain-containing protein [Rhizobium sp. YIM 134829]|uniref:DUF429 domain-containing protein n=1 Tax=Rhizobium sp. YIM 134829 TaxID=3390453 RepID=UPI00397B3446